MQRLVRRLMSTTRMQCSSPVRPLITVLGATGTGKSELAVALAERFNGEIVNGDAMQLYAGLPVITNKIPVEEQHGIPHHLLGCIGLGEETWVVGNFVQRALKVIEDIHIKGKLPILVGGTHYYTQSLMFDGELADEDGRRNKGHDDSQRNPMLDLPTDQLLIELEKVDPLMAQRWHPNDRRKIQRSLELYLTTGKKASEIYAEQRIPNNANATSLDNLDKNGLTKALRFPSLLLWVHTEHDILRQRLDQRVLRMVDHGLIDEVNLLLSHALASQQTDEPVNETRGIWISIGYKEFIDYAKALNSEPQNQDELKRLKSLAIEKTQAATRQYAKRQIRWIRLKLLNALREAGAEDQLYALDSSDVTKFPETVVAPAVQLCDLFLKGQSLPLPESLSAMSAKVLGSGREYDISSRPEQWEKHYCSVCDVTSVIAEQWDEHVNSKTHKKLVARAKKAREDTRVEVG